MYHHNQNLQGKNSFPSSRMSFPQERHLFMQGGNGNGDTGLVLSTDAKPRLKWTSELHERFIEAVNQLGGPDKATPKTVMKLMGVPGLTLYHLKSHLQKFRLSKNLHGQANSMFNKNVMVGSRMCEENGAHMSNVSFGSQANKSLQINEALNMQIEVQRRLHEQLEVQRHLQLRIEAQGKYLQSVLEKAQETLGRQNLGSSELENAKMNISELVSKASNESLNSSVLGLKEMSGFRPQKIKTTLPADCSMDSCLTSCEGSQKEQEMHNNAPFGAKEIGEDSAFGHFESTQCEDLNEKKMISFYVGTDGEKISFPVQRSSSELSMSISFQGEKENGTRKKERFENDIVIDQTKTRLPSIQVENKKILNGFRTPYLTAKLDLNVNEENDGATSCKQFDLNGFSWN